MTEFRPLTEEELDALASGTASVAVKRMARAEVIDLRRKTGWKQKRQDEVIAEWNRRANEYLRASEKLRRISTVLLEML